jgi:hypothetical protein
MEDLKKQKVKKKNWMPKDDDIKPPKTKTTMEN